MKVIGLISGTSVDGIDAAVVDIREIETKITIEFLRGKTFAYDSALRSEIMAVADGKPISCEQMADLDDRIAEAFGFVAQKMKEENETIDLIASHGQTVFHRFANKESMGYSIQLGRGALIAHLTGITTVSNFRQADINAGGQGAPMVSMLDWLLLTDAKTDRAVQNIGGISNVTFLPAKGTTAEVIGFDNAPGNVLIDRAAQMLLDLPYDPEGNNAACGKVDHVLCQAWLDHSFFRLSPPKSTGRELFNHHFLLACWQQAKESGLTIEDFLATLTELTVRGILDSYDRFLPRLPGEIILCGGGTRNLYLTRRLTELAYPMQIQTTDRYGIPSDYKEAIAFALLGYLRINDRPGNIISVTGAKRSLPLGDIFIPPDRSAVRL